MGCARYFREWHRPVRIVAVDAVGSVTFGGPPARRMIPGLGTGIRPPLLDESYIDEVVIVEEADTIRACHRLASRGFLFGGSTGTVVSGAMGWLARHDTPELTAVAIAPDLGERYLDTVYQTNWLQDLYGSDVLRAVQADRRPGAQRPPARRGAADQPGQRRPACRQRAELSPQETVEVPGPRRGPGRSGPPRTTESVLAEVLAEVLHVEQVPVDANFFDDLGADSMVMAQFCARVRKRADLPRSSIKDVYQHPTISRLATALAPPPTAATPVEQALRPGAGRGPARRAGAGRRELLRRPRRRLDGHGPVLRPRPQARRPAPVVDQGRLPAPHDQPPGHRARAADQQPRRTGPRPTSRRGHARSTPCRSTPLLRRPRRRLHGHGPVLRPRPQARRPARGVDQGRLRAPDDRRPGGGVRTSRPGSRGARHPGVDPSVPARTEAPVQASTVEYVAVWSPAVPALPAATPTSPGSSSSGAYEWIRRRWRSARQLRAGGTGRRGHLPPHDHLPGPGEVGAHRPVEAPADPHLELCLRPVLVREDAGHGQPDDPVRRLTDLWSGTCGRWARRWAGASRSSPGTCPCAPICSPSATARSSGRTPTSTATAPTPA